LQEDHLHAKAKNQILKIFKTFFSYLQLGFYKVQFDISLNFVHVVVIPFLYTKIPIPIYLYEVNHRKLDYAEEYSIQFHQQ
jgi:hypothetical protein